MLILHEVDTNTCRNNNKKMKKYLPTTFFQTIFLWKTVYMIRNSIWQKGVFLFSDPMGIPYDLYETINFSLNCGDHHIC